MLSRRALLTVACLLATTAVAFSANPRPRPFHGNVTATWDNIFLGFTPGGATFEGGGPVTHMGKTTQTGSLFFSAPPDEFGVAPGFGSVTIVAANGDELTFDYEGLLYAATGEGIGTFTFTGGTGRFSDATGGGDFYALIDLSVPEQQPMMVVLNGEIAYSGSAHQ